MKKRVYIVHGWGGKPAEHWLPWLKEKLEARGLEVTLPTMPDTDEPVIEKWVSHLAKAVGQPDEQTYFVGHSIGCQTILRYLETTPNQTVGGCVFVAGWFKLENLEDEKEEQIAEPWLRDDIRFEKVLSTTENFVVLISSNDPYNAVAENKLLFEQRVGARVTIMKNMGHFTTDDNVTALPEVAQVLQEFMSSPS